MRRHHGGSGRARVIPVDWAAHHRPVVAGTFTATVEIRHPGGTAGEFDPETGTRETVPHEPHYTGSARLQARPNVAEPVAGGQEITIRDYLVAVDLVDSVNTRVDDQLTVTAVDDNGDPALVGGVLDITGVGSGSLVWERDLIATLNLG